MTLRRLVVAVATGLKRAKCTNGFLWECPIPQPLLLWCEGTLLERFCARGSSTNAKTYTIMEGLPKGVV
jgi:hypothetical protein